MNDWLRFPLSVLVSVVHQSGQVRGCIKNTFDSSVESELRCKKEARNRTQQEREEVET